MLHRHGNCDIMIHIVYLIRRCLMSNQKILHDTQNKILENYKNEPLFHYKPPHNLSLTFITLTL